MGVDAIDEHFGKLKAFRSEVLTKVSKFWSDSKDIALAIHQSLGEFNAQKNLTGWVRADTAIDAIAASRLADEIARLSLENQELRDKFRRDGDNDEIAPDNLAGLDDNFQVSGNYQISGSNQHYPWTENVSWREIFAFIAPYLRENPNEPIVERELAKALLSKKERKGAYGASINNQIFKTISLQLTALDLARQDLVKTTAGGRGMFWSLTSKGERLMFRDRTVRRSEDSGALR